MPSVAQSCCSCCSCARSHLKDHPKFSFEVSTDRSGPFVESEIVLKAVGRVVWLWPMLPLVLLLLARSTAAADIKGKVGLSVDGFNVVALKPGTVTELLLTDSAGQHLRTFADREGWFTLHDVSPGSYVLTTYNPMFVYPEVYVDVTAKSGLARASYVFNKQQVMVKPFVIRPAVQAQYYEMRKPLDLWSMIKSPYGLMLGFMLFGIFVFPMLKVDPDEYKEAMAQLRGDEAAGGQQQPQQQQQQRIRDR